MFLSELLADAERRYAEGLTNIQTLHRQLYQIREVKRCIAWALSGNPPLSRARGQLRHLHISLEKIRCCRTQRQACQVIAEYSGGIVAVSETSKIIAAAGLSQGKVASIRSSIDHQMNANPNWEWAAPGLYRLVGDQDRFHRPKGYAARMQNRRNAQ